MDSGDSVQETLVSEAELRHTDNSAEGVSRLHWALRLGGNQRHISWRLEGSAEVKVTRTSSWHSKSPLSDPRPVLRPRDFQATAVQHDQGFAPIPV